MKLSDVEFQGDGKKATSAEMQRKSQLAAEIARAIKARRLTQQGAAELLGVDQSKVSRITRGQFRGVSEATLLELVPKLGHDVKIVVGPARRRAGAPARSNCSSPDQLPCDTSVPTTISEGLSDSFAADASK